MRTVGITLRNLLVYLFCVATAANILIPSVYIIITGIVAEQTGKTLPVATPPFTSAVVSFAFALLGFGTIVTGGFVSRMMSLWTASSILMAFPLLKLAHMHLPQYLPAKFMTAWELVGGVHDAVWWSLFGAAALLYLFCGPFGHSEPQQPEPVRSTSPERREASGS